MAQDPDPSYRDPSIYDTREVPVTSANNQSSTNQSANYRATAPSSEPPESSRHKGCLFGCLIVLIVLVIGAIALGVYAKHTYNHWMHGTATTTTTLPAAGAVPVTAVQYGELVGRHGSVLQTDSQAVGSQCKNVVTNRTACRQSIAAFRDELSATKTDLSKVKAPAGLSKTDGKLRQSVDDGLDGSNNVVAGLNGHPISLVKGLAQVAKAATELKSAEDQVNGDLGRPAS